MAKYVRIRVSIEESTLSDYTKADIHREFEETFTPDETSGLATMEVPNTATAISTTHLATCSKLWVKNTHASTMVQIVVQTVNEGLSSQDIPAGEQVLLTDIDPSTAPTLAAASGTVECQYWFIGS